MNKSGPSIDPEGHRIKIIIIGSKSVVVPSTTICYILNIKQLEMHRIK